MRKQTIHSIYLQIATGISICANALEQSNGLLMLYKNDSYVGHINLHIHSLKEIQVTAESMHYDVVKIPALSNNEVAYDERDLF